jgi:hypothetical protein
MAAIHYDLIRRNGKTLGLLLSDIEHYTPVTGYEAEIEDTASKCRLAENGCLRTFAGFTWDFGSGPAIDTPAVVRASLSHDAFCLLTDRGLIPWECRAIADTYYREQLKRYGTGFFRRWWHYAGVRSYSKTVAYWSRTK